MNIIKKPKKKTKNQRREMNITSRTRKILES